MRTQLSLILVSALALGACGEDTVDPDPDTGVADTGTGSDSMVGEDSTPADTGSALACSWPEMGYGTNIGRAMEPITLQTCDGTSFTYPNDGYCDTRFTVISIGAGWCRPCIIESEQFEAEINERYDDADVRLIQILVQDEEFNAPTEEFCNQWVARFGLTNDQLIDPAQLSNIYFPSGALPSTIIVDNATGTIVFREVGAEEGLLSLRNELDALLAE